MTPESVVFDHAAGYYDETRGFPPGAGQRAAALFCQVGDLTAHSRVLEVGIGTGRIALPLAPHVRAVTGVDIARPMVERLLAKRDGEPIFPMIADAQRLPLASGVFDAVIGVHVFHLIPDWPAALAEVARVLVTDGLLLIGWNDRPQRSAGEDVLWNAWDSVVQKKDIHNVGVQRDEYRTFLPDSGWRQVGDNLEITYSDVHTAHTFLDRMERRVWSSCWRLPDDVVKRGVAAVRAAIRQHGIDPHAPITTEQVFVVQAFLPPVSR